MTQEHFLLRAKAASEKAHKFFFFFLKKGMLRKCSEFCTKIMFYLHYHSQAEQLMNPTSIHEDMGSFPGLTQ